MAAPPVPAASSAASNGGHEHAAPPAISPANSPSPATTTPPAASGRTASDELNREIDEAMAKLGFGTSGGGGEERKGSKPKPPAKPTVTPIGGPMKAKVHGPRVVQAGREHRSGAVVSVGPTDIFLEFGPKELGVAPRAQWPEEELPKVGQELEVVIDRFEVAESIYICSRPGTVQKAAWELLEVGQVVEGRVTGVNKGGLELEVAGHRAFMPASQVGLDRVEDLNVFMGQKFPCQVSQVDRRGKGNIVLSRRDVLEVERRQKAEKIKETLKEGDVVDGIVRKIMPFGAFVDIGGVDGLVHIGDITYDRIGFGEGAIGKHVKEGQAVKVRVLKLDWDNKRLSLGLKQTQSDPFQTALADIKEGAEIGGRVTRLADFGAFVELSPGVEGLVHVSEIAHRRINVPGDVLKQDEVVKVRVMKIDAESRRISLSVKALLPAPEAPAGRPGGKDRKPPGRTPEEIAKETPALRRMREQAKSKELKGGFGKGYDDGGGLAGLRLGQ
ncbi:MAG: S1 RNA-binding domain-containing protein [Phycisphaerales bacterium]